MLKRILFVSIILFASCLYGASTLKWKFDSYNEFEKGDFLNVSLSEDGELTLAPELSRVAEVDSMYIWDIKSDSKGNIYLATGNQGIVYKVDNKGNVSKFFETASVAAFKIIVDKNDNLYVSTLTRGLIYKIGPSSKGEVFAVFKGEQIWDMIFDDYGNIIIATGNPGALYKLDITTREFKEICLTREMHILTVINDHKGNYYFGTSDRGAVYKYSTDKDSLSVIYQTGENEVHTLCLRDDGILYAGTSDKEFKLPLIQKFDDSKDITGESASQQSPSQQKNEEIYKSLKKPTNAVYKIMPSGYVKKIIELIDTIFLSMILDNKDRLYVGTGSDGIIYRCDKNDKVEKMVTLDDEQVLSFYKNKDNMIYVGTGNTGNIYSLKINYFTSGNYTSYILDATGWARWGRIRWDWTQDEDTDITVQTRSGNTSEVDDTWSDWSEEYKNSEGSLITSPYAQYLQFKIIFYTKDKKKTPKLYNIEIPYLLNNRPPEILSFKVILPDGMDGKDSSEIKTTVPKLNQWERKLEWKANDPDGDKLIYTVKAKLEGTNDWITLSKEIEKEEYILDIRMLPDGIYDFMIIANDLPDNGEGYNLTAYKISKKYIIDTVPPIINNLSWKKKSDDSYKISGRVIDELSRIKNISYSIDAKKWINIFPNDMLYDSNIEDFHFVYKDSNKPNIIMIMAKDEWGNITTKYLKISE